MVRASQKLTKLSRRALAVHYDGFLRSLGDKRPETRGTYQRALREFIRWFARQQGFAFRVRDIERYKRHLAVRKNLSSVSVSTYLTALRRFCEYLVSRHVLPSNPAREVEGNKRPVAHSRGVISSADVGSLLSSVDCRDERGLRDFAFIKLMIGCALSEIEIVRADVGDLGLGPGDPTLLVQGKGRVTKDEIVPLPVDVADSITRYLAARGEVSPEAPLFTSAGNRTRGMRMTTRGVRDRVNSYLERAGIKQGRLRKITPYSLRHTAAVMMAEQGATADEIKRRLRLGSIATAMLYINQKETPGLTSETGPATGQE